MLSARWLYGLKYIKSDNCYLLQSAYSGGWSKVQLVVSKQVHISLKYLIRAAICLFCRVTMSEGVDFAS